MADRRVRLPVLRYEPRLQTEVVSGLLRGLARLRYHAEAEALYTECPPELRDDAFVRLDDRTFRATRLQLIFEKALHSVGPWPGPLEVRVCTARSPEEEGADLTDPGSGMAVLRVRPARVCGDRKGFQAFLMNEFTHLRDLLDPAFGYRPDHPAPGETMARANIIRDRYRVLWNASVEGRLARCAEVAPGAREARRSEVRRAFVAIGEDEADRLFEDVWAGRLFGHAALLATARRYPANGPSGLAPGGTCPLCGFVTWDVAPPAELVSVTASIRADTPTWKPDDGACGRCAELYHTSMEEGAWRSSEEIC